MKDALQEDEVIRHLLQWANQQDAIRAMLMTSTRAIPNATVDPLSDYDIILVVPDIHPFHRDRSWLQAFGHVLVSYWDPILQWPAGNFNYFGSVIYFQDGRHIDFTLWPVALLQQIAAAPTLPDELDAGYRILLDKDNLTAGLQAPTYRSYIPTPPTAETFQRMVEEFFSDAPYVAKCLWRDELLPAKWCLDYDMKHVYLRPMVEWYMEIDHSWAMKTGVLGRGLKKQLPPALWSQLESSYAGASIEDNWAALLQTMALFRQVATAVAAHLGYTYPLAMDEGVTAYVAQVRRLDHQ
jgi:aminoglycoside 6-adenylyltransferase